MGPQAPKAPPQQKSAFPAKAPGFLDRLLALFASDDPERQKQTAACATLRPSCGEAGPISTIPTKSMAEPGLARFFWEIYKAVAAAQVLVKGAEVSGALKMTLVESSLSEEQAAAEGAAVGKVDR